jgi:prophage antirepressor-like protein
MTALALTFNKVRFDVVDRKGQPWLRGQQVADALGYKNHRQAIDDLYSRNADEFADSMTALVRIKTPGGMQTVRVFSLRGCHLLGMFARTEVAKTFRKWVLDILDRETKPATDRQSHYHASADAFARSGWLTVDELAHTPRRPLLELLDQLKADGCDVSSARLEYQALRYHVGAMAATLRLMADMANTQLLRGVPVTL